MKLDRDTLEARIHRLFTEELHLPVPDAAADLIADGTLDSLVFVDLLFRLEKEFGLRFAIETIEADELRSVRSIAEFVRHRLPAA